MSRQVELGTCVLQANRDAADPASEEGRLLASLQGAIRERKWGGEYVSQALRELGSYYDHQSLYAKALQCYEENVNLWKRNQRDRKFCSNDNGRVVVKRNLGTSSHHVDMHANAMTDHVHTVCRIGNAYHDLALTYKYMENYPEAIRLVHESVCVFMDRVCAL